MSRSVFISLLMAVMSCAALLSFGGARAVANGLADRVHTGYLVLYVDAASVLSGCF